ncbi:MAG: N-acetylglucosaminyl deacetylase, LmbE family/N-acetylglucosaminyl deacetylase, LmbE family [Chloroflexi bacterium]|jgi:LmbE family N-acetylglucosaminyl deacetylase|nr:MAG: N-acetylglucosaminyl deacetylase, LmbE family/N-acetylglucosaminyl deacetylase, LmbE family [Chloroflexota bacterium]
MHAEGDAITTNDTTPDQDAPKVAAVIAAHPDDPDFGAGGTAALWTQQGWEFHYIVVTNGAKGSDDPDMTRERLVAAREVEQRACASVLGVSSCTFLGGEDGELDYSREMLGKIVREIRRLKPLAVFTHSDQMIHRRPFSSLQGESEYVGFVNHRDHRNTGTMAVDAVYPTARDHMNFPEHIDTEGLETHKVGQLYIWGHSDANFKVDITDSAERKLAGLMEHKTQFGSRGDDFIPGMRDRFRDKDGNFYERFLRVDMPF